MRTEHLGDNDLALVSAGGEKLLELECHSPSIRDVWVRLLCTLPHHET